MSGAEGLGGVWGLDTGRLGEFRQVALLGGSLGLPFAALRLVGGSALPEALPEGPPPRLIIGFGRAAGAALRLRARLPGRPLLVHLGTPGRVPMAALDLILPMPQDACPPGPNVLQLRLPLNGARDGDGVLPAPGPGHRHGHGIVVVVGGPSRQFRLPDSALRRLLDFAARLRAAHGGGIDIVTSPRTPPAAVTVLRRLAAAHGLALHVHGEDAPPFDALLRNGACFLVTGDSASMLAETCRSGAPVWLLPLPRRLAPLTRLQQGADHWLGPRWRHALVRRGWLGAGTDYRRWHDDLARRGYIRLTSGAPDEALDWAPASGLPDDDLGRCRARIMQLLAAAAA